MSNNYKNISAHVLVVFIAIIIPAIHFQTRSNWFRERDNLRERIRLLTEAINVDAKIRVPLEGLSGSVTNRLLISPQNVLSELFSLETSNAERDSVYNMHIVLYRLGLLVHFGNDALPSIKEFLENGYDRNYPLFRALTDADSRSIDNESNVKVLGYNFSHHPRSRYDFAFPPTLRLGVMQTLEAIGGTDAENILASVLSQSGRGVEVYFAYKSLERLAPGRHSSTAVAIAKELLDRNSPTWPQGDRFGDRNYDYLFLMLAECKDPSLASLAPRWIIDGQGHLNLNALDYCLLTFKENSVPILQRAYNDSRLGDVRERMYIAGLASDYCGVTDTANAFISNVIRDNSLPGILRSMMAQSLNGYNMFTKKYVDISPDAMRSRIDLARTMSDDQDTEQFLKAPLRTAAYMLNQKLEKNVNGQ